MTITDDQLLERLDELIGQGQEMLERRATVAFHGFFAGALSFIERVYHSAHPYALEFESLRRRRPGHQKPELSAISGGVQILKVIRSEIEAGWLSTLKGQIVAEVFSDFLEMAEYFLDNNYQDAAAVLIGGVLEEHLRQLCSKHSIPYSVRGFQISSDGGQSWGHRYDIMMIQLADGDLMAVFRVGSLLD